MTERHPATAGILRYFDFGHLPDRLQEISRIAHDAAHEVVDLVPDSPELTAGLRHLLEAKDCFVRAALDVMNSETDRG
jgi:hypothetical protein